MTTLVPRFSFGGAINWFPGHMAKATKQIQSRIAGSDIICEVRDARVPFSSHNHMLEPMLQARPRVIVFNKADLANPNLQPRIAARCEADGVPCVFATSKDGRGSSMKKLVGIVRDAARKRSEFNVAGCTMLVVGVPNVGKSSVINSFRETGLRGARQGKKKKKKGVVTGARPGLTRHVSSILVSEDPAVFLTDTPGVMMPRIDDVEVGLKLALVGAFRDATVPDPALVDYLLYLFNTMGSSRYVKELQLDGPTDDVSTVLDHTATLLHAYRRNGVLDQEAAARHILSRFRNGGLGRFTLDAIEDDDNKAKENVLK